MGQELTVQVPHSVLTLMEYRGQGTGLEPAYSGARLPLPAILLSEIFQAPLSIGQPDHDCSEVMDEVFSSGTDLRDQPLKDPDAEYFTNSSSFVKEGECLQGITFGGPTEISPEPTRLLVNGSYLIPIDLVENPPPWMASSLIAESCQILAAKPINPPKPPTPTAPPVLPDNQDLLSLDPPPYQIPPLIPKAAPIPAAPAEPPWGQSPRAAGHTRRRAPHEPGLRLPDSTVALPLREIGPPDETGNPRLQYWPFSTSDLYNWKTQNARFSDNPKDLISLLDSVMFTHQPTWDDCQQLLRILFTTEERERIQLEARKLVPGDDGQPTANLDLINAAFPLTRPPQDGWDYNTAEDPDLDTPLHDCAEILAQVHGVREDLQDHPLPDAEVTWFTDGSSFVHQSQRYVGAAVTTETETVWAEPLPAGTSAQRAELVALTKAMTLGKDKKLNVYTDSRYAFAMAHTHGAIYRERGLLTVEGKTIKNKEEILALLKALWLPKRLAIIHCPGHQKLVTPVARGNNLADQVA
ncbi:uncharacterized protein LOC128775279 [Panthera pardus]|uniref:Uncharacterized protein LOC128775279 n=1 Tax=Panthera pardus TaxID=9691 RepID=A0A9W2V0I8_PANPR|nr:uncharacterized protein LOC128775279 [Panthera pardus]